MKNILLTIILFALVIPAAIAQSVDWIKTSNVTSNDELITDLTTNSTGNVFVCGQFFGATVISTIDLNSNGASDVFVVCYSEQGDLQWINTFGGSQHDEAHAIITDNNGDVWVTGFFIDTIYVGDTVLISQDSRDLFLIKYSSTGDYLLSFSLGNNEYDEGLDLEKGDSSIYLTGFVTDSVTIGDSIFVGTEAEMMLEPVYFIAKVNLDGNIAWAKWGGAKVCVNDDYIYTYILAQEGPFYGSQVLRILRYDNNGNGGLWYQATYPGDNDVIFETYDFSTQMIKLDNQNNIIISGQYSGPFNLESYTFFSYGAAFVAKFDSEANLQWAYSLDVVDYDYNSTIRDLAIDNNNNIYLAGDFNGTLVLPDSLTSMETDGFLLKFSPEGEILGSFSFGGTGHDYFKSI